MSHEQDPFGVSKGLKKIPFMLPKAPPANSTKVLGQQQDWQSGLATGATQKKAAKRGKSVYDLIPQGPRADDKVKAKLSGADPSETLSRIGRATRRQNKEFHAQVHPISGRVKAMVRGDHTSTHFPSPKPTKARERLAEMAETARNPQVRDRALKAATNQSEKTAGPKPLYVHNHPENPGGKAKLKRAYPSAADTQAQNLFPGGFKGAVVSRADAPRGGKKTKVVYFGPGPDKVKASRVTGKKVSGARPIEGDEATRSQRAQKLEIQDFATQPKEINNLHRSDAAGSRADKRITIRHTQRRAKQMAERDDLRGGEIKGWDRFVREKTASPGEAAKTGIHTRERMMKSAFGIDHEPLAKGYRLGHYYKRELLIPAGKAIKTGAGKLKPLAEKAKKKKAA